MIININSDWCIASDPLQWIVQQRRTVKGGDRWDGRAYLRTLDEAVVWLARRRIMCMRGQYGPDALPALCQALDRLEADIRKALADLQDRLDGPQPPFARSR